MYSEVVFFYFGECIIVIPRILKRLPILPVVQKFLEQRTVVL